MTTRRELLRWTALAPLAGVAGMMPQAAAADALTPLWQAWTSVHMTAEGRVVDRWQDNASHSEGQSYGLLLAEAMGDRENFERILDWSTRNLAVRPDALRAWKWAPESGGPGDGPGTVTDMNNASDGDLFHAWALLRAAQRFGVADWTRLAGEIGSALAASCVRPDPAGKGGVVLLPGAEGFEIDGGVVLNPSYWCPRAMMAVGRVAGSQELESAGADAVAHLATLSRSSLPPDWVSLTAAGYAEAPGKSANYGYEALRVPLNLVWSGLSGHPAVLRAAAAYQPFLLNDLPDIPTIIAPVGGQILETSPDPGYRAIANLAACLEPESNLRAMPAFTAAQPYYPATLHLLSLVAQREASFLCYSF
ncbi:glycosyl hydrolase family 8 [Palleronia abyssalis]|uniref:cellulase n=1 Tax=Palleronia abyssalis TaxID=1501240 RepID=A0A2R8C0L8_9RHOB|nr:glycosyl hydrolase family 8 [Palleronia abyssalis]SPJ25960.1 Minor endoglucanase Y [Palleronia abyssalis]